MSHTAHGITRKRAAAAALSMGVAVAAWKVSETAARKARAGRIPPGKKILILGGGFAGVHVARELRRLLPETALDITLVSDRPSLVFTPLLAGTAGGEDAPDDTLSPLRALVPDVGFVMGHVTAISLETRSATVALGNGESGAPRREVTLSADHLVLVLGAQTDFHGIPGLREHALVMKDAEDAAEIEARLPALLERAAGETDPDTRHALLTVVVGGAGFTGVETMAAVNARLRELAQGHAGVSPSEIRTVLVDVVDRLLPQIGEDLAAYARRTLERNGVEIKLSTRVTGAAEGYVELEGGNRIPTRTLIWSGGIEPPPAVKSLNAPHGRGQALAVDACLAVPGHPGVWAGGDCADTPKPGGGYYAPLAQNAEREGTHIAANIVAALCGQEPKPFTYRPIGQLALVGPRAGIADILGVHLSGLPAWLIWHAAYLVKIPTMDQRLRVGLAWVFGPREQTGPTPWKEQFS